MQSPSTRICAVVTALVLAAACAATALPTEARAAPIEVTVDVRGVRDASGQVLVAAHGDKATFPSAWARAAATVRARSVPGTLTVRLRLPGPGRYAFIALHDANDNGRMDKRLVGIPEEGFGTTDGQRGLRFPRFSPALQQVDAPSTLTIDLGYP
jgi:uncharacterized protein (DUF2141 family)